LPVVIGAEPANAHEIAAIFVTFEAKHAALDDGDTTDCVRDADAVAPRTLIILRPTIVAIRLAWPCIGRIGFGRLPGDVIVARENFRLYALLGPCLLVSVVLSLLLWLLNRSGPSATRAAGQK
jgi:hypothetical protein